MTLGLKLFIATGDIFQFQKITFRCYGYSIVIADRADARKRCLYYMKLGQSAGMIFQI